MRSTPKFVLPLGAGLLLVTTFAVVAWYAGNTPWRSPSSYGPPVSAGHRAFAVTPPRQAAPYTRLTLTANTGEPERLGWWAESVDISQIAGMLEGLASVSDNGAREQARAGLLSSWARRDRAGALRWFADRGGADRLHEQARDVFAQTMADGNPGAQLLWMERALPACSRRELYGPFFRRWTSRDPPTAAAWVRQMTTSSFDRADDSRAQWIDLTGQLAARWANEDLSSAVNWARSLPDGPAREHALVQVSGPWAEADPRAAAMYAAGQNNPRLLENVAGRWADNDPQAAAAWAEALPSSETSAIAIGSIAATWAQKDPAAAADYVAGLSPGQAQDRAALTVIAVWADSAPDQVAQWVGQFPESAVGERAVELLMCAWSRHDSAAAGRWLRSLPRELSRDVAVDGD